MKPWITPLLCRLLSFSIAFSPLLAVADDTSGTTSALQGVVGALQTSGQFVSTLSASNAQMQQMANSFSSLGQQNSAASTATNTLAATQSALSSALATASACVNQAETTKNTDQARYKKATIASAAQLTNMEPTCENYGNIVDSGRKLVDALAASKKKAACLKQLQSAVAQVADQAKSAFSQLNQAATTVWQTNQDIIDDHKAIIDRIDGDLNGDNGYKAQLAALTTKASALYQAINAGATKGSDGSSSSGLATRVRAAKVARNTTASTWYKSLMSDTQNCMSTKQVSCGPNYVNSPLGCVSQLLSSNTMGTSVSGAAGAANLDSLNRTLGLSSATLSNVNTTTMDVTNVNNFLNYANQSFSTIVTKQLANFSSQSFYGNTDRNSLLNFVQQQYNQCFSDAETRFKSDLQSQGGNGGPYYSALNGVKENEDSLNAEIKGQIDDAQSAMNTFRTNFTKVYSSDLPQFSANCTAGDDPYQSLDCLRMVSATLKAGIEGTSQTVKLDGSASGLTSFTAQAPATGITLQTITLNSAGTPTLGTQATTCVGFNDCINVLTQYEQSHKDQMQTQTQTQHQFVVNSNKQTQAALAQVASQFTAVSQLFNTEVSNLNTALAAEGVSSTFKTKQVEGEQLEADDKTGLFKQPKSMLAAIAGQGSITQLDDSADDATSALQTQYEDISKKVAEALAMKNKSCNVKKADYSAIADALGNCDASKVCGTNGSKIASLLSPLEALMRKSQPTGLADGGGSSNSDIANAYQSCMSRARSESRTSDSSLKDQVLLTGNDPSAKSTLANLISEDRATRATQSKDDASACGDTAMAAITALAQGSRSTLSDQNIKVANQAKALISACSDPDTAAGDNTDAVAACKALKSTANGANIPDEGETKLDGDSTKTPGFSNPAASSGK